MVRRRRVITFELFLKRSDYHTILSFLMPERFIRGLSSRNVNEIFRDRGTR